MLLPMLGVWMRAGPGCRPTEGEARLATCRRVDMRCTEGSCSGGSPQRQAMRGPARRDLEVAMAGLSRQHARVQGEPAGLGRRRPLSRCPRIHAVGRRCHPSRFGGAPSTRTTTPASAETQRGPRSPEGLASIVVRPVSSGAAGVDGARHRRHPRGADRGRHRLRRGRPRPSPRPSGAPAACRGGPARSCRARRCP